MSLNLTSPAPSPYIDAVNDARFVFTFGIIALFGSIFFVVIGGGALTIGVGLAVSGFGKEYYYRALGLTVVVLAILAMLLNVLVFGAPMVLAAGVAWKGKTILDALAVAGREDPDWHVTRKSK